MVKEGPCWLLGALVLACSWTLVSSSHACGGNIAGDVMHTWNKLHETLSTESRLIFMEAVIRELESLYPEASKELPTSTDTVNDKAKVLRLLTDISTLINLLGHSRVLWNQVKYLLTFGEDFGGGKGMHLPTVLKAMDPVMSQASGNFSGEKMINWRTCVATLEKLVQDSFRDMVGDGPDLVAATCFIKPQTGDPTKPVRGSIIISQKENDPTTTVIKVKLQGFSKEGSKHGMHIHEEGATSNHCRDAGGHFNPEHREHGAPTDDVRHRHVGDLGNIKVDANHRVDVVLTDKEVQLSGHHNVIGRTLVVHALRDDLGKGEYPDSKTTGHAGARIGCCVIKKLNLLSASPASDHKPEPYHWTYHGDHGPSHWEDGFPACGGTRQSPVNIDTASVPRGAAEMFQLSIAYAMGHVMEMTNNGHTAKVALAGDYTLKGGSLPGTYKAVQFHLHWGSDDGKGSEHTVDGKSYPLELHIVHMNTKYEEIGAALKDEEGLAVLGVFFEIQEEDNPRLTRLIDHLENIENAGDVTTLESMVLTRFLPDNLRDYYRYYGSLTTPPCSQAVVWTLFTEPLGISAAQMEAFRSLLDDHGEPLVDNFRPVQLLHARQVYHRGNA